MASASDRPMLVVADVRPLSRRKDPLTFTCAIAARAEQSMTDRKVPTAVLRRAVPYTRPDEFPLSPTFFRALHRITDALNRPEVA